MILDLKKAKCEGCGAKVDISSIESIWLHRFPDGRLALPFCSENCCRDWADRHEPNHLN